MFIVINVHSDVWFFFFSQLQLAFGVRSNHEIICLVTFMVCYCRSLAGASGTSRSAWPLSVLTLQQQHRSELICNGGQVVLNVYQFVFIFMITWYWATAEPLEILWGLNVNPFVLKYVRRLVHVLQFCWQNRGVRPPPIHLMGSSLSNSWLIDQI